MANGKRKLKAGSPEQLIADLRRVAEGGGTGSVTQSQYMEQGVFSVNAVVKACGTWVDALRQAGLAALHRYWRPEACLQGIGRLAGELGRLPSYGEFRAVATQRGWPCVSTVENHFGTWSKALQVYQGSPFVMVAKPEAEAWRSMVEDPEEEVAPHAFGETTGFDRMPYAPTCENGVLVLFGMLAHDLGFIVESVRPAFPDCSVKKWDPKQKRFEQIHVEFELKSSGFHKHQHPHDERTLIVAWEHDWVDKPASLEVLCLKDYLLSRCRVPQRRSGTA